MARISYHLLFHNPDLGSQNFNSRFDVFPWHDNPDGLRAWQRGQTGYPIVDAGMRQLWQTGWMHTRVRMIVASFLIKHLMIDWREGEAWFWDTLVDADPASNAASWQWVAGSARTLPPIIASSTRSFRVRNSIPRAAMCASTSPNWLGYRMPSCTIHGLPVRSISQRPGSPLAPPILTRSSDHGFARTRALDAFKSLKETAAAA